MIDVVDNNGCDSGFFLLSVEQTTCLHTVVPPSLQQVGFLFRWLHEKKNPKKQNKKPHLHSAGVFAIIPLELSSSGCTIRFHNNTVSQSVKAWSIKEIPQISISNLLLWRKEVWALFSLLQMRQPAWRCRWPWTVNRRWSTASRCLSWLKMGQRALGFWWSTSTPS